jgi:hypothetical protein
MSVGSRSRHNYANKIRRTNGAGNLVEFERYDIRPTLTRTQFQDNTQYVPNGSDNWSRIAWQTLGDGRLYWIIADCSGVIDPLSELAPESKTRFVAQLSMALAPGQINQAILTRTKGIQRGTILRIEDLDPNNLVSIDVSVLSLNPETKVITFSPVTLAGNIVAITSRVSVLYKKPIVLNVPSTSRALFELLDFNNPLSTLVT